MSRKCACGSGKKAHKCCELSASSLYSLDEQIERKYHSIRIAEYRLFSKLWIYTDDIFGEYNTLADALDVFNQGLPEELTEDDIDISTSIGQFFMSWLWFNYRPFQSTDNDAESTAKLSLAEVVLEEPEFWGKPLTADELAFLRAGVDTAFSWYVAEDVREGLETTLRDVFSDEIVVVRDHKASDFRLKGCYLLGRVMRLFGMNVLMGVWPDGADNYYTSMVLKAHDAAVKAMSDERLSNDPAVMVDMVKRTIFIQLVSDIKVAAQTPREMVNHDGDSFVILSVRFAIALPLSEVEPILRGFNGPGELAIEAKHNRKGNLTTLEATYSRAPRSAGKTDPIVVAHLKFEKSSLAASVNSYERVEEIKALLKNLVGEKALFKSCRKVPRSKEATASVEDNDLAQHPEVKERLKELAQRHWEQWFDTPVPMLDNMTPRESAKSERGRVLLAALFKHYEEMSAKVIGGTNVADPDIDHLRAVLGMTTVS